MGPKFGSAVASPPWDGAGLGTRRSPRVTTQNSVVQGQTTWIYVDGIKTVWISSLAIGARLTYNNMPFPT